jgi:putative heme iron utilization protein
MEGERIMAEMPPAAEAVEETPGFAARKLLRGTRAATLATVTVGQPFAALVTPATAPDLSVLLFLSQLSEHSRHLRADPRCAVLVVGVAESANPQTAPRLSVTGIAEPEPDPALKARWLAIHPYAALYADFPDFTLWRIRPRAGLLVSGFARANRLRADDLLPDDAAVQAVAATEPEIIAHCNADHADAMAAIGAAVTGTPGAWRIVAADVDGCDLALDEHVARAHWGAPATGAGGVRAELIRLAQAARAAAGG